MRIILSIAVLLSVTALRAQTVMPMGVGGYSSGGMFANNLYYGDSLSKKKWSFNSFSGISAYYTFFKGGNASIISAPVGLQVNRRLNNNLYAFANISVAPAYINFNRSFITNGFNKTSPGSMYSTSNSIGVYSAASMGLMYINDEKTFSISGSFSVGKSGGSMLPVYPTNVSRPIPLNSSNR